MIDIFLSRPTWIEEQFIEGLDGFLNVLKGFDFNPRTLGISDYPNKAPLDEVLGLMSECNGAIILGYPQIYANESNIKGKFQSDRLVLPTEWNHIEASLAYSRELPLLLIHHNDIKRGVFDHGALNCFIYAVDLSKPNWAIGSTISGALKKWKTDTINYKPNTTQIDYESKEPFCPNCSTGDKKIFMSKVPKDFIDIIGANYECTKCNYTKMIE